MNRRDLLRGLLALPLAPLAAELLPKEAPRYAGMDLGSSDLTSIWLVGWGKNHSFRASEDHKFIARMMQDMENDYRRIWLKTPVTVNDEGGFYQQNLLLQKRINGH